MSKELISLRLPDKTKIKLEKLAKATGRTRSFLALEAIEQYIQLQSWQIKAIQEGLREANEGHFVDHDTVKQRWEKKRARAMDKTRRTGS